MERRSACRRFTEGVHSFRERAESISGKLEEVQREEKRPSADSVLRGKRTGQQRWLERNSESKVPHKPRNWNRVGRCSMKIVEGYDLGRT